MNKSLYDTESGQQLGSLEDETYAGWWTAFTPDGSTMVHGTWEGSVFIFDVAAMAAGAPAEEVVLNEISAHETGVLRVKVSPDGKMAATWSWNEPIKLWDLDTRRSLGQFGTAPEGFDFLGFDFHPSLPQLIVVSPPNNVRIHTLDIDELVAIAESRLSREMTEEECLQYFREPCPAP